MKARAPDDDAGRSALIKAAKAAPASEAGAPPPAATPAKRRRRVPAPPVDYLERTRHAPINMLFLAPWVLVYLLCWLWAGARVETSAAASVRTGLRLLGEKGMFTLTVCGTLAVCAVLLARVRTARRDAAVFPWMLVEGIVYGLLLHLVAAGFSQAMPVGKWIGLARWAPGAEAVQALGIAAGAGIFEELVFRGCLATAAYRVVRDIVGADRLTSGALAVLSSALLFAAYHHWGAGGEPWDAARFTFRFHAGAILGVIFFTRGLGIAAFAHALYDAIVLLS